MVWIFIFLALGAVAYTIYLILEHLREGGLIDAQIQRTESGKFGAEIQIKDCEGARDLAKAKVAEAERAIKEIQMTVDELQRQISDHRKEMERRGRYRV